MKYLDQYKEIHKQKNYGISGDHLVGQLMPLIDKKITSLLDFGCGRSNTSELLRKQLGLPEKEVSRYDPAVEGRDTVPSRSFHTVICTDVLEHIPEEELNDVLVDIWGFADKQAIFVIAMREASAILPNGENAHCTVQQKEWWEEKLRTVFDSVKYLSGPSVPYTTSWFTCDSTSQYQRG